MTKIDNRFNDLDTAHFALKVTEFETPSARAENRPGVLSYDFCGFPLLKGHVKFWNLTYELTGVLANFECQVTISRQLKPAAS